MCSVGSRFALPLLHSHLDSLPLETEPFPMHIGGLKPYNNVFLAPMAGVTDLPMRELAIETGA